MVDLAEKGIKADAAGQVVGDKFYMPVDQAGIIKPFSGYLLGEELAFVKTFSFFAGIRDSSAARQPLRAYIVDILAAVADADAAELAPELGLAVTPVPLEERERSVRESNIEFYLDSY